MQPELIFPTTISAVPWKDLELGAILGHGSYGDVYLAQWLGTEVAVKCLGKKLPSHLTEVFPNEAQVLAECRFPNVIGCYGICMDAGKTALILEYMSGGSLYEFIQNPIKEISWDLRWRISHDIAKGLKFVHNKGIIHGDLKSSNILLDSNMRAVISDFGLAKTKSQIATTETTTGTLNWRAPESFAFRFRPHTSMDVYSFGMVMWELASRSIPFQSDVPALIKDWITSNQKEHIPDDCPAPFASIIQSCWQSAQERPTMVEITQLISSFDSNPSEAPLIPFPAVQVFESQTLSRSALVERLVRLGVALGSLRLSSAVFYGPPPEERHPTAAGTLNTSIEQVTKAYKELGVNFSPRVYDKAAYLPLRNVFTRHDLEGGGGFVLVLFFCELRLIQQFVGELMQTYRSKRDVEESLNGFYQMVSPLQDTLIGGWPYTIDLLQHNRAVKAAYSTLMHLLKVTLEQNRSVSPNLNWFLWTIDELITRAKNE